MRSSSGIHAPRIAYCGPIAQPGQPARGGYESANRRLIDDLRLHGCDVIELPYPTTQGSQIRKGFAYLSRFVSLAFELVRQRRRYDILHLTFLYWRLSYPEAVLCAIARTLGKKVLLDIRAGYFIRFYEIRGPLYRSVIDSMLRRADLVAAEGAEYIPFVEAHRKGPVVYLPNYVSGTPTLNRRDDSMTEPIRLIYAGRIVSKKGIETVIDALRALNKLGLAARLTIVGKGDPAYVAPLERSSSGLPIHWTGALSPEETRKQLAGADFFVFPSRHIGEGHSNALTEAMSEGVVPICSDQGFNRSVVAEAGRVLTAGATADDYASAVADIWRSGQWPVLSRKAHNRVTNHFSAGAVVPELLANYDALLVDYG